jgi:centrin-3
LIQFAVFDIDKDNRLEYNEFRFALRALGFELPKPETFSYIQKFGIAPSSWDRDRRGECGPVWREFNLAIFQGIAGTLMAKRDPLEECRRAYRLFDKEGKGMISFEDLRAMAVQIGQPLDDGQIRRMISEFDADGKGGVDVEEFTRIMMRSRS